MLVYLGSCIVLTMGLVPLRGIILRYGPMRAPFIPLIQFAGLTPKDYYAPIIYKNIDISQENFETSGVARLHKPRKAARAAAIWDFSR